METYTPRKGYNTEDRIKLSLSKKQVEEFHETGVVYITKGKKTYMMVRADCGLRCKCDAVAFTR